jgi:hypothetical protein
MQKMSKPKKISSFFLLFLFPSFFSYAQPQSFYFSPGQTITDGTIVRGYCLEYSKAVPSVSNLTELTKIAGIVTVVDKNGMEEITNFDELLKDEGKRVRIIPYDSYEFLRFVFLDESIVQIKIGQAGISLFREEMTEYENELVRVNIQKILELEAQGKPHAEVQEIIWRTRIEKRSEILGRRLTIDWQTTEKDEDKVSHTFDESPTVSYGKDGKIFMRIDGLLGNASEINEYIIELITHYHSDHISRSVVEQCLREGSFSRLIAPQPVLDVSRNRVFSVIDENAMTREYNFRQENRFLEITPEGTPLTRNNTGTIGDFNYSRFNVNEDITIEMFKYRNPHDANTDGLIYRFIHKNFSTLIFGDFDDVAGIENLIVASLTNERRYMEIKEERSMLMIPLLETQDKVRSLVIRNMMLEELAQIPEENFENIEEKQQIINIMDVISVQLAEQEIILAELKNSFESLSESLRSLPFIKADVIKWPHHAHIFPDSTDGIIRKLNEVLDPRYIIWQRHHTQGVEDFREYIKRFYFENKFLCSEEIEINFLSLLEHSCWLGAVWCRVRDSSAQNESKTIKGV